MNTFKIFWASLFASIFFVIEVIFYSLTSVAYTIVDSFLVVLKVLGITVIVILGAYALYGIAECVLALT